MTIGRDNIILKQVGSKIRVILCDCRTFVGTLVAHDKYINLVLKNCIEYRKYKPRKCKEEVEEKRTLGFIVLRGENVVSMMLEDPSKDSDKSRSSSPSTSGRSGSSRR